MRRERELSRSAELIITALGLVVTIVSVWIAYRSEYRMMMFPTNKDVKTMVESTPAATSVPPTISEPIIILPTPVIVKTPTSAPEMQGMFEDSFERATLGDLKWHNSQNFAEIGFIQEGELLLNTPLREIPREDYYSLNARLADAEYNIATIDDVRYTQRVISTPAPTRSDMGIKLTCGNGGWLRLFVGGMDNQLRLSYAPFNSSSAEKTLFIGEFPANQNHDIVIGWKERMLSISLNESPMVTIADFNCTTLQAVEFYAHVLDCQADTVAGAFDNVIVKGR